MPDLVSNDMNGVHVNNIILIGIGNVKDFECGRCRLFINGSLEGNDWLWHNHGRLFCHKGLLGHNRLVKEDWARIDDATTSSGSFLKERRGAREGSTSLFFTT